MIWASFSCALVALASCSGNTQESESGRGGGGSGGSNVGGNDSGGTEAIAGSAGTDPEHTSDAGAVGNAGSFSSAGSGGDAGSGAGSFSLAGSAGDGGSGGVSVACSFSAPPEAPAPFDSSASLEESAEGQALIQLDYIVGRYLRGDVLVYRGTASAQSNAGVIGEVEQSPNFDDTLPDGPVLARLDYRPLSAYDYWPAKPNVSGDAAILFLDSLLTHKSVILSQASTQPSLTDASNVIADDRINGAVLGLVSACTSCAPPFWARPEAIVLDDLVTAGTYPARPPSGPPIEVTLHTTVSARLALASPCSLTYGDLDALNDMGDFGNNNAMKRFEREGGEMVWHVTGTWAPHAGVESCWFAQRYTLDAFIDLSDLSHYGVRNLQLGDLVRQCQFA